MARIPNIVIEFKYAPLYDAEAKLPENTSDKVLAWLEPKSDVNYRSYWWVTSYNHTRKVWQAPLSHVVTYWTYLPGEPTE